MTDELIPYDMGSATEVLREMFPAAFTETTTLPSEYEPSSAGTLSLAMLDRMLDGMWDQPHPDAYLDASSPARDWEYGYGSSQIDRQPAQCNAVLFPLPTDMWEPAIWRGQVVDPVIARMIRPMQGPQPATCAREPHPDSPYHWDGKGTWWQ